jgi:hypothetical protein
MKSIVFCYTTVTPESAENGDFEDTGFTDGGRNHLTSPVEFINPSMHIKGFSPGETSHIKRILKTGKISDSDEALLEGIMILDALGVSTY